MSRLGRGLCRSPGEAAGGGRQFGAVPYRHVGGETVFLMITARRTGKWIFPKGDPIQGLTPAQSAAEEAYEEAGVRGRVGAAPAGHYRIVKASAGGRAPVVVEMYPLEVEDQLDDWPEKGERKRHWAMLAEVRRLLSEPALVAMAEKIADGGSG